jgi:membrane associated rhomboid family serine protease
MFPLRDHNPSATTPYVTYAIIAANIVVFLIELPFMGDDYALAGFFDHWAMIPGRIAAGSDLHTLISSMFLHAGFMHIAGNMLFLWIFGDNLEDQMGHVGFLIFYLATGLAAGAAQIAADPASMIPTVGASGAIAGVMGGYLLLFPRARVDVLLILVVFFRVFSIPAWIMLILWFGLQVFGGLGTPEAGGGVAYWAHVGGFVAGLLLTLPVWLRRGAKGFWQRTEGHPPHPEAQYSPSTIPVIRRRR